MSKRTNIPEKIVSELLFISGRKCCLCKAYAGKNIQLHHIDGDPSNNDQSNLIPLCLNCHSEVQTKSFMGRNYSADELKRHRFNCLEKYNNHKKTAYTESKLTNKHSNEILSLMAIHEIRRIRYKIEYEQGKLELFKRDWDQIENYLWQLLPFGREYYEYSVRSEIILTASRASDDARYGIKKNTVFAITTVLMESLPIYHIVYPAKHRITKKDIELIARALDVGR